MGYNNIWNKAFDIFTDGERTEGAQYNDMQRFLMEQVKAGRITMSEKCIIAHDIMETAGLF